MQSDDQTDTKDQRDNHSPMFEFIDAHHHLWDLSACHYPWLMARGEKRFFGDPSPIQQDYLLSDFLNESDRYRPQRSVHIQVGVAKEDEVNETQWLSSLGDFPHAIVAAADLSSPQLGSQLDRHLAFPKVRGVRQILGRHHVEDRKHASDQLIENPAFFDGLSLLADQGPSFDLQLIPQQMERIAALMQRLPALNVVLCHCGSPWEQTGAGLEQWKRGLAALAVLPNMRCKISGLGMFNPTWEGDQLEPIIHEAVDYFGPDRIMFGSNFPVDKLYGSYDKLWRAYEDALCRYTASERQQMLIDTAKGFYHLP